ncbi:uncharacterized protein STEHIDRAFT_163303 [Stereum hirsutum FP-91666 SS1]|uniref:Uncharacterized protein n=1 Tax=Stereum hirsutum (strain FP-91666) TaxID=721885 RepID=R7RWQ1_STEHR|nr:uncharacterized protein STEHIDRAFT_163303 [Stereum hirsutum FP-91666 SS1]EIM79744.1 hypothetical protein STEHIDRAFT_163303 [Stereum hirsutum FP-91666 SS1]
MDVYTSKLVCTSTPNTDVMSRSGDGEGAGEGAEEEEKDGVWLDEGNQIVKDGEVRPRCVDQAMWQVGGASVALRLVQLAQPSQKVFGLQLSRRKIVTKATST